MSRSAVVAAVAGLGLAIGLVIVGVDVWPGLATRSLAERALAIGLAAYGGVLAAVSIRRLVDPSLPIPAIAYLVMFAWVMFGAAARAKRLEDEGKLPHEDTRADEPSKPLPTRMGLGWAVVATLGALAMYGGGIALAWHWWKTGPAVVAPGKPTIVKAAVLAEAPPPAPQDILEAASLDDAVAFALPAMTDEASAPSAGAKILARYGAAKLGWADVVVTTNETSLALVETNAAPHRGKRLCVSGTLARIEAQTIDGVALHAARLMTKTKTGIEVLAFGPTGKLAKGKPARFCGVVTERHASAGKPVTFAVGMFETR